MASYLFAHNTAETGDKKCIEYTGAHNCANAHVTFGQKSGIHVDEKLWSRCGKRQKGGTGYSIGQTKVCKANAFIKIISVS